MKHKKIAWLVAALFLLSIVSITMLYGIGIVRIRGDNYEIGRNISSILHDDFKKGDHKGKIVNWLKNNDLELFQFIDDRYELDHTSQIRENIRRFTGTKSVIFVHIPDVEYSFLSAYSVDVLFFLDENERLIGFYYEKGAVGP